MDDSLEYIFWAVFILIYILWPALKPIRNNTLSGKSAETAESCGAGPINTETVSLKKDGDFCTGKLNIFVIALKVPRLIFAALFVNFLFQIRENGPVYAGYFILGLISIILMAKKQTLSFHEKNRHFKPGENALEGVVRVLANLFSVIAVMASISGFIVSVALFSDNQVASVLLFSGSFILFSGCVMFFLGTRIVPWIGYLTLVFMVPVTAITILGIAASGMSP